MDAHTTLSIGNIIFQVCGPLFFGFFPPRPLKPSKNNPSFWSFYFAFNNGQRFYTEAGKKCPGAFHWENFGVKDGKKALACGANI